MKRYLFAKTPRSLVAPVALAAVMLAFPLGAGRALAADDSPKVINGRIGYVLTDRHWSLLQSPEGKTECPNGLNDGPREQFALLFPADGPKRTMREGVLAREGDVWHPSTSQEPYPFYEAQGPIAIGLNLDGKVDANDFTSPDGEKGIDSQLYRAIGCINNYRAPEGTIWRAEAQIMHDVNYNRIMIEITNVDSLIDDDDVTVTTYHGRDAVMLGADGTPQPGGSQRVDMRWGKLFIQTFPGKIKDGVLTAGPADFAFPWTGQQAGNSPLQPLRDMRFRLNLTPDRAEGLIGGYSDIMGFYLNLNQNWSTHHQSYGQQSSQSLYRALWRLADAYPDPETGANTAISASIDVKFVQAFLAHPPARLAQKPIEPVTDNALGLARQR